MIIDRIHVGILSNEQVLIDALQLRSASSPRTEVVWSSAATEDIPKASIPPALDVMLLDIDAGDGIALRLASDLRVNPGNMKLLFLGARVTDICLEQAMRIQADGFVLKTDPLDRVVEAIETVADGKKFFSGRIHDRLTYNDKKKRHSLRVDPPLGVLTNRQLDILRLLANGDSVKAVARKLHLSPKSVDSHKYRIMLKIGVNDRVHLSRYAIREGLIPA